MDSVALEKNSKKLKKWIGDIVTIKWRDAHHDHITDWSTTDKLEFPDTIIASVGFLVKVDNHHIMIASTRCRGDGNVCGFFTITKKQIIEIKRIA
jgi:hypothetical protein